MTARRSRAHVAAATLLLAPLWLAGCGSDDPEAGDEPRGQVSERATQQPSADADSPTESSAVVTPDPSERNVPTARSLGRCLLTVDAVSEVIAGSWDLEAADSGCTFRSDRGAFLGVRPVGPDGESIASLQMGLRAAREECTSDIREVPRIGAFACFEQDEGGDMVIGNVIGGTRLWVLVVPAPPTEEGQGALLDAMQAILRQLPAA